MLFRTALSRRDGILLVVGALLMHVITVLMPSSSSSADASIIINNHLQHIHDHANLPIPELDPLPPPPERGLDPVTRVKTIIVPTLPRISLEDTHDELPHTSVVHHAPGWTLFRNLYMSDGTLFILSDNRSFPEVRLMTSTGLPAENTPENIALREPTEKDMAFITPEEAKSRWGGDKLNRVMTVHGNTLLVNEPTQFLRHYYHLVAELFFGAQAFWHGSFSKASSELSNSAKLTHSSPPPLDRVIFARSNADGWRDGPGFNAYFLRAAFPSLTVEVIEDWQDRIVATSSAKSVDRAWHFPMVLLTDRSAAHRGAICGSQTQRIASEAWDYMRKQNLLMGMKAGGWWEPVRSAVLRFAGADVDRRAMQTLEVPEKVVISYISRQGVSRRKLTDESHLSLVSSLEELCTRRGWELNVLAAETMTKDMQLREAARTTIMLGVHGNGLSHLLWMPPTKTSAVIEIFYPGGFAHDYHWTSRALGMSHYAVWNDTYYTYPNEPNVDYPEGFQENYIPVHGPAVARLVEDRMDSKI